MFNLTIFVLLLMEARPSLRSGLHPNNCTRCHLLQIWCRKWSQFNYYERMHMPDIGHSHDKAKLEFISIRTILSLSQPTQQICCRRLLKLCIKILKNLYKRMYGYWIEIKKIVTKGEITHDEQFLGLPYCFLKGVGIWEWVN